MISKNKFFYAVAFLILLLPFKVNSGNFFQWQSTNLQLLRGQNYEIGDKHRSIITLEHAHRHRFGDTFFFIDTIKPDQGKVSYYGELSPRLSTSSLFNTDLSKGMSQDVLFAFTLENPKNADTRYLYGASLDLNIPRFNFVSLSTYVRDDPQLDGKTWQLTLAWQRPFQFMDKNLVFEGFADLAGGEGGGVANQLTAPRLLIDIGELFSLEKNKIWIGIEYTYWHNKFGIDGITESLPQAQIKWLL